MRLNHLFATLSLAVAALLSPLAHADTFVYVVSNHFASFQVDGTITTDTNAGILSLDNILDFQLLLTGGGQSEVLSTGNASNVALYGDALSATDSGLFFDYDAFASGFTVQNTGTQTYLCYQTYGCDSGFDSHESTNVSGSAAMEPQSGVVQIASFQASAVTPEPSSLFLLATGLTSTCMLVRKRQAGI